MIVIVIALSSHLERWYSNCFWVICYPVRINGVGEFVETHLFTSHLSYRSLSLSPLPSFNFLMPVFPFSLFAFLALLDVKAVARFGHRNIKIKIKNQQYPVLYCSELSFHLYFSHESSVSYIKTCLCVCCIYVCRYLILFCLWILQVDCDMSKCSFVEMEFWG